MSTLIWRGDRLSKSAIALKKALRINGLRAFVNRRGAPYRTSRRRTKVINWGRNDMPVAFLDNNVRVLNHSAAVYNAQCKLRAYERMAEHNVALPEFTTERGTAEGWWQDGKKVLCRATTTGSQGVGITLVTPDDPYRDGLPAAPLYVEYVPKKCEYRMHVFRRGDGYVVADIQQKRKRREVDNDDVNYQVRNARHGWVFCRSDLATPPRAALAEAIKAVEALGLDFGAVDLGVTEKNGRIAVYEVNTAPGLEGTTLDVYAANLTCM